MGYIRYRMGMSDLRHLRHTLNAADEAGALRRADWVRLQPISCHPWCQGTSDPRHRRKCSHLIKP
jgi:hypothetical protein